MWLFTTMGFFSATLSPEQPDRIQLRARVREDLEKICNTYGFDREIIETPEADYRWRIILPQDEFAQLAAILASAVYYQNFKGAMADTPDQCAKVPGLHRVWSVARAWQLDKARASKGQPG